MIAQTFVACAFVLTWEFLTTTGVLNAFYYGQPTQIFAHAARMSLDGSLLNATLVTLSETVVGFALGTAIGVMGGFALWWSRTAAAVLEPLLVALQAVPKVIFAPVFILLIGVDFWFKVTVSLAAVVIVALVTTYAGARETDADLVDLLRQVFTTVVVPTALPWIITCMEINVGFALIGAVVAEFIASNEGLGYLAMYGAGTFDMNLVLVPVVVLMVLAAAMYSVVLFAESRLVPWRPPRRDAQWTI
jgi:NitT/TauT family transport system permease protein